MDRRRFIQAAGAGLAGLAAGCSAEPVEETPTDGSGDDGSTDTPTDSAGNDDDTPTDTATATPTGTTRSETPTLRIGTYGSFVDAPSTSPGGWVKEQFESEYDAEIQWFAPEGGMNYFLQRRQQGVTIDTDLYLGLTPENLVTADTGVESDDSLFTSVDTSALSNVSSVVDDYYFDPQDRAIPFGASYISLVYNQNMLDERGASAPETFDDLTAESLGDGLLVPNPQNSETGLEFLFWTIDQFGEDDYLDYWSRLIDNGARILEGWSAAYSAYSSDEAPMVVSYSTDQVFADRFDQDMARHQVGFLDDSGYAYLEGMAPFAGTDRMDVAVDFMDFILKPDVQAEVAQRNVALPAVTNATLPSDYDDLVYEPERTVNFGYDELVGKKDDWLDQWSQQVASN